LGGALGATAAAPLLAQAAGRAAEGTAQETAPAVGKRKIKLGLVGCGGRGSWIAALFQKHGGYEFHAVADYFPQVADRGGEKLGVDKPRRFSGLSGYKKVIDSGVEAVVLIVPPGFLPEHAGAAAEAGLHVYMAKPVAVDVPGCLRVESAGKLATKQDRVFFVDYQIPTDPVNIEVVKRIHNGELGEIAKIVTVGTSGGHKDPPLTANIESRLQDGIWNYDIPLGGAWCVSFDVHAVDAAMWVLGRRPVAAMGAARVTRPNPHGDSPDVASEVFEYADGLIHEHSNLALPNGADGELACKVYGQKGHAFINYWRKSHFHIRGEKEYTEPVVNLYEAGAVRNIATFYQDVTGGRFENPTVKRAVDGCLTCILGREAGLRHGRLTMEELLRENRRREMDTSGLKV
jgi:predicted dehydrogenase